MKQFFKNLGAMLYTFVLSGLSFAFITFILGLFVALPTWLIIILAIFCASTMLGLLIGISGAALTPPIGWINGTLSGKIMCISAIVLAFIRYIFVVIDMIQKFNSMNDHGETTYLVLMIIAIILCLVEVICFSLAITIQDNNL